jgi:electron transfer flavoprotein beta subunit
VKIVASVKQVPDANAAPRLDPDGTIARDRDLVLDPGDECSVEIALRLKEAHGGEVVLVSMGPETARDAVRKGLSMGADRGILISDDALAGADALLTARVLAAAIAHEAPDLVICATESYDGSTGMVPPMLAELLDMAQLTFATSIDVSDDVVTVHRRTEDGHELVQTRLPALLTVTAAIAEPRYPSLKAIMAARSKQVTQVSLADIGIDVGERVETVEEVIDAESRPGGEIVADDGSSGVERILQVLSAAQIL